mgnify:CR=1 FL=1
MPNKTYKEFSKGLLEGSSTDYDNSNDEFLKFLKKDDNSDFDLGVEIIPEFDYATSLTSKDLPRHESIFSNKMESYDEI